MATNLRIVVLDRSILALNIYEMILKTSHFSAIPFQSLQELKKSWPFKFEVSSLLMNTNVFNDFASNIQWFCEEPLLVSLPKVFLIGESEKKFLKLLHEVPSSSYLMRPFLPRELQECFQNLLRKKSDDLRHNPLL